MRLHPIVWELFRTAGEDDIIPLAFPITSVRGEKVSAIPVLKGQSITVQFACYNRNPDVWGVDADEFRPERFLDAKAAATASVGVYANLLNFSAGVRGCIGWRFSVYEMQALACTLLEHFAFALPPQTEENRIERKPTGNMIPFAKGHKGGWMGLKVKAIA
jgi:cytochrome P450